MISKILGHACRRVLSGADMPVSVLFTDGQRFANRQGLPEIEIRFLKRRAELNAMIFGQWGLIESYINGSAEIDGDFRLLIRAVAQSGPDLAQMHRQNVYPPLIRLLNFFHEVRHGNRSVKRGMENAQAHYGRGTEMFGQYLDPTRTYTCAYWKRGTRDLAEAQYNKLDHVCRKLLLKPGERLVDVGGGWGSLLLYACENYGVYGTNCSPVGDQNRWLRQQIEGRGLTGKIRIEEKDFRQMTGTFDKYVSLGVYEHAGRAQLADWIAAMAGCLRPGGIGLLHFIAHDIPMDTDFFIRKHVFPGGYLPGLSETVELMARHGLEILDIENLRRHYALTLDAWFDNFEKNWPLIQAIDPAVYDERFRRIWRVYLNACAEYFRVENSVLRLYQITFSRGNTSHYPMDRGFIYRGAVSAKNGNQPAAGPKEAAP